MTLKYFVVSDSYGERSVYLAICCLLNKKNIEILFLEENHHLCECFEVNNDIGVKIINSVDEGILYSDKILILNNGNIPEESIRYIYEQANKFNKQCYETNYPWLDDSLDKMDIFDEKDDLSCNVPVILNLGLGKHVQLHYTELLINKILKNNQVRFFQHYSKITRNLLANLEHLDYSLSLCDSSNGDLDVCVYSLNITNDVYEIRNYLDFIRRINPDFVILQVDDSFDEFDIAQNFINYGGLATLDLIIKSPYNMYNQYCFYSNNRNQNNYNETSNIISIEDLSLKKKMEFDLFSKIALPEGVTQF